MKDAWNRRFALVVLAVVALTVGSFAQERDRELRHRVPAEYMSYRGADWLERVERLTEEQPERVLDAMGLQPGDVVADVGCGSGYYARRMARRVMPGGTVYCEDIQTEMLEIMMDRATEESVTGIRPVLGTATDPKLPQGQIDWVIIADVYHEMSEPEMMLAGIRQSLSMNGRVALLEYRVEDGSGEQIKADHAMSVRQVLQEWQAAGFELTALHDFLPSQHLFFFRAARDYASNEALVDYDLNDAIDSGQIETTVVGHDDESVNLRVRKTGHATIVVTFPVATYFEAHGNASDMVTRRDGWIVLEDNDWHDWSVSALMLDQKSGIPGPETRLTVNRPNTNSAIEAALNAIQVGTYTVADSPTLYPPRIHSVAQAAVWILNEDADYEMIESSIAGPRLPAPYAAAFALVFIDTAGIDITRFRVWENHETIFQPLRDRGLNLWYQLKTEGQ